MLACRRAAPPDVVVMRACGAVKRPEIDLDFGWNTRWMLYDGHVERMTIRSGLKRGLWKPALQHRSKLALIRDIRPRLCQAARVLPSYTRPVTGYRLQVLPMSYRCV